MKVLICDDLPPIGKEIMEKAGFEVTVKTGQAEADLIKLVPEYDAVIVRSATKITAPVIEAAKGKLKVAARAGEGVDNIDVNAATAHKVYVFNTPGENSNAACEHTLALLLSMLRNTPAADKSMKEGKWEKKAFKGTEIKGKKVGVIGFGKIGREVAKRIRAFEADVSIADPFIKKHDVEALGMKLVDLNTLFKESDIITIHVPKTPETANMIDKAQFDMMKKGVKIVNCARGGLINEAALAEALKSGKVSAAAFDVFVKEPPENWELAKMPNVIATPHLGASTTEAGINVSRAAAERIVDALKHKKYDKALNFSKIGK